MSDDLIKMTLNGREFLMEPSSSDIQLIKRSPPPRRWWRELFQTERTVRIEFQDNKGYVARATLYKSSEAWERMQELEPTIESPFTINID